MAPPMMRSGEHSLRISATLIFFLAFGCKVGAGANAKAELLSRNVSNVAAPPAEETKRFPILLFWAVGNAPRAIELVQKNVAQARASAGQDCCEVFLAHYSGGPSDWPQDWYDREVSQHVSTKGFKFQLLQQVYETRGKDWVDRYDFVWALDEDIDFSATNFGLQLKLAKESGALIVGPALNQVGGTVTWQVQVPQPGCNFRYTNYVEVIAPMVRTVALKAILEDCEDCIHPQDVWGLDGVWCNFAASRNPTLVTPKTSCAILDATPIIHQNWKTLTEKYHGRHREDQSFRRSSQRDADDIKARYPQFYVTGKKQQTFECVKGRGGSHAAAATHASRKLHGLSKLMKSLGEKN